MQLYLASSIDKTANHIANKIFLQGRTLKAIKAAFIFTAGEVEADKTWIDGGNSFYLLVQAQKSGFDRFIKNQVSKGVIYTGSSAGSYLTSPDISIARLIDHNSYVDQLKNTHGFNLVDFIVFPHWGSDNFKTEYLNERMKLAYQTGYKIILLNDDQYVEVTDNNYKIIDITKD